MQSAWIAIAQAPLIWVVVCEVFFFAYLMRDKGLTGSPRLALTRVWPILRILMLGLLGAFVGLLLGRLISETAGWIGFFIGTLPACLLVDQLLRKMRPGQSIWRWVASLVAGLQMSISALTLFT